MPQDLVGAALQGLVPVEEEERHVLHRVADARQVLRGTCEGLGHCCEAWNTLINPGASCPSECATGRTGYDQ
jgi:hypothetical protein